MNATPAAEAIALLIDLAQRGEIDPWDVRVIEVIDRCLSELALLGDGEPGQRNANLSQSGQAFLWASMLVLLKADTLAYSEEPEDDPGIDLEELTAEGGQQLPRHLERHLRRRPAAPPPKRRPVTLQELIVQLQQIAAELESPTAVSRVRRPRLQSHSQAAKAISQLAHDENLTEIATQLDQFLTQHWVASGMAENWLPLEQLLEWWTMSPMAVEEAHRRDSNEAEHSPNGDRVAVFWALLLLSAQSKVELSQEEFYQDLNIRLLTEEINVNG